MMLMSHQLFLKETCIIMNMLDKEIKFADLEPTTKEKIKIHYL